MTDFDNAENLHALEDILTDIYATDDVEQKAGESDSNETILEESGLSIYPETAIEFSSEPDSLEDFSSGEQGITISDTNGESLFSDASNNPLEASEQVQEQGQVSGQDTGQSDANQDTVKVIALDDSGSLSIIGIVLSDEERTTYLESLTKQEEYQEKLSETLDTFLQNHEELLKQQEELVNINMTVAQNQKEIARTLKINNTLMFALLFGVLALFGAMLANAIWSRFQ